MSDGAAVPATAAGSTGETDTLEETAQQREERQFQVGLPKNRSPTSKWLNLMNMIGFHMVPPKATSDSRFGMHLLLKSSDLQDFHLF